MNYTGLEHPNLHAGGICYLSGMLLGLRCFCWPQWNALRAERMPKWTHLGEVVLMTILQCGTLLPDWARLLQVF